MQKVTSARFRRWPPLRIALAILGLGVGILLVASQIPLHTDETAYQRASQVLLKDVPDLNRIDQSLAQFFAMQDHYKTARYPIWDSGLTVAAWGLLGLVLIWVDRLGVFRMSSSRIWLVLGLAFASIVGIWLGLMFWCGSLLHRHLLPWWADSIIISMVQLTVVSLVVAPAAAILALWPLVLRNRVSVPIVSGPILHPASFVYVLLALVFLLAAIRSAAMGSGWVISLGSGGMVWLLLNARALIVAPRRSAVAAL